VQNITKKQLRERILTLLRKQEEQARVAKSLKICNKFFKMPHLKEANTILFYASFNGEVDTFEMIKKAKKLGKRICLPTVIREKNKIVPMLVESLEEDLEMGSYGMLQPKPDKCKAINPKKIDAAVIPGVAFDKSNNRLGRGGGYYDRFLKTLSADVPCIGLAFDFQIVDHLPFQEEHDVSVSHVLVN